MTASWLWPALAGWLCAAGVWAVYVLVTTPNHRKDQR